VLAQREAGKRCFRWTAAWWMRQSWGWQSARWRWRALNKFNGEFSGSFYNHKDETNDFKIQDLLLALRRSHFTWV
jgi:hypothetical protein